MPDSDNLQTLFPSGPYPGQAWNVGPVAWLVGIIEIQVEVGFPSFSDRVIHCVCSFSQVTESCYVALLNHILEEEVRDTLGQSGFWSCTMI
jgi:hypothetical protein